MSRIVIKLLFAGINRFIRRIRVCHKNILEALKSIRNCHPGATMYLVIVTFFLTIPWFVLAQQEC